MRFDRPYIVPAVVLSLIGFVIGSGCTANTETGTTSSADAPVIVCEHDDFELYIDEGLDIADMGISVTDAQGQELTLSDSLQKGTYTVTDTYIPRVLGAFEVYVTAMDSDGNVAKDVFFVSTKERPSAQPSDLAEANKALLETVTEAASVK